MNYGVIHNRRSDSSQSNRISSMKSMAKTMGVDPRELGSEAENIWKMLDDMAVNDPEAYKSFIESNLKRPDTKGRSFTPNPGFVIKVFDMKQTKIFINCCAHAAVDAPLDPQGRPISPNPRDVRFTSNLQIPLAIGDMRKVGQESVQAVDAVFNPWVLERCTYDASFKRDVVNLAMNWLEKEQRVVLQKPGKLIKSKYKGGFGTGEKVQAVPFPLPVPEEEKPVENEARMEMSDQHNVEEKRSLMKDPSTLLQQLTKGPIEEEVPQTDILISPSEDSKPKKKLIEVIDPEPTQEATKVEVPVEKSTRQAPKKTSKAKAQSVVKKGFLNNNKSKPLYKEGSNEGTPPSAYVKLLSRSKVVDMSNMSPEETQRAMSGRASKPAHKEVQKKASPSLTKNEEDHGDYEFDMLCREAEPDLEGRKMGADEYAMSSQFERIANLLPQKS